MTLSNIPLTNPFNLTSQPSRSMCLVHKQNTKASPDGYAWDICMKMSELGLLAKPTHGNIIRFAPPLCISDSELSEALEIMRKALTP